METAAPKTSSAATRDRMVKAARETLVAEGFDSTGWELKVP